MMRITKIHIILLLFSFGILKTYAESADTLLSKYGLSSDYFEIVLVKDASKNVFRNLSSDAIKPTDTIIIAKVDTFQNILNIKGKSLNHRLVLSGIIFKKAFHSTLVDSKRRFISMNVNFLIELILVSLYLTQP